MGVNDLIAKEVNSNDTVDLVDEKAVHQRNRVVKFFTTSKWKKMYWPYMIGLVLACIISVQLTLVDMTQEVNGEIIVLNPFKPIYFMGAVAAIYQIVATYFVVSGAKTSEIKRMAKGVKLHLYLQKLMYILTIIFAVIGGIISLVMLFQIGALGLFSGAIFGGVMYLSLLLLKRVIKLLSQTYDVLNLYNNHYREIERTETIRSILSVYAFLFIIIIMLSASLLLMNIGDTSVLSDLFSMNGILNIVQYGINGFILFYSINLLTYFDTFIRRSDDTFDVTSINVASQS